MVVNQYLCFGLQKINQTYKIFELWKLKERYSQKFF